MLAFFSNGRQEVVLADRSCVARLIGFGGFGRY